MESLLGTLLTVGKSPAVMALLWREGGLLHPLEMSPTRTQLRVQPELLTVSIPFSSQL